MSRNPDNSMKKLNSIVSNLRNIFNYDGQLIFSDSFERIKQQLNLAEDLLSAVNTDDPNYWVVNNIVLALLPFTERLIFNGYSDQILEFLLTMNHALSSNLLYCTSRYIPLRLQLFTTICSAFANTEESREKDADLFIQTFKSDLIQMRQLEEANINGLTAKITTCTGHNIALAELYATAFSTIELMSAHFNPSEDIEYEKLGSSRKNAKRRGKVVKEEPPPQIAPVPQPHICEMIINAFNAPFPKGEYNAKFGQVIQGWTNPECNLGPALLYRLIYSFLKSGTIEGLDNLANVLPEDPIVKLAIAIAEEKWLNVSKVMNELPVSIISVDFQFYNEIAMKIWTRYVNGKITDPMVLQGVLHVLVLSPSPCPLQTSVVALHYCWHLDSIELYNEAAQASKAAIDVVETYRDFFIIRKNKRVIGSTNKIPNKPLDQSFLLFEKWIECLHVDLYTIWIRSVLKYNVQLEVAAARKRFDEEIEETKKECVKTKMLYGTLSAKQQQTFTTLINRPFKPPQHCQDAEQKLLEQFKSNPYLKTLIYIQMAFFQPLKAASFLEKARDCLNEVEALALGSNSPVLYDNRSEIAIIFPYSIPEAKKIALYGKETVGSTGLTLANTALANTGIKQDKIEPFIVNKLKPNTLYSFAFGCFDSTGDLIDNLMEPFSLITCQTMSIELIWAYLASASYHLKDYASFDVALTYLLQVFTNVQEVPEEHAFFQHLNPFNRFVLKPTTLSEPAPMLRSFSSALLMASRLFINKPLHALSFQRIALIISQILKNYELTLTICREMFAILQPLLMNTFHTTWVIHPLIYIINALKNNKPTASSELHQETLSRAAFILDQIFMTLYQERQLASFVMSTVIEQPANPTRTAFIQFAARQQLLESNISDGQLPLVAAEMFRVSPERSYDDLFSKFKLDPQFPKAAVFLVHSAHSTNLIPQGVNWSNQALEYIKQNLHEPEEKPQSKKPNQRQNAKQPPKKKPVTPKGKRGQEQVKETVEDQAEIAAATKIQAVWNRYHHRCQNIAKFNAVNCYRASLNLLNAMCLMENDTNLTIAASQETVRTGRADKKHHTSKPKSRHAVASKRGGSVADDSSVDSEQALQVINALRRAIVLAYRSDDWTTIHVAACLLKVFLTTLCPGTPSFMAVSTNINSTINVLIDYLPLYENWAQALMQDLMLFLLGDSQTQNMLDDMIKMTRICQQCGLMFWMFEGQLPEVLVPIEKEIQRRDPAENLFFQADAILQRAKSQLFHPETKEGLLQGVGTIVINLQHKQKLSMSISLLTRLAFTLLANNETKLVVTKLCEALECHFRIVKAHEKIDQILANETESSFYQKHSWAGCISIFVISSFISMHVDRAHSMMLSKLASFAISALFTASQYNPKKQIDYAAFEPAEIIPGIDIFTEYDPNQPFMEPPNVEYISIALSNLLSSMMSYEMYFEIFKPLAFARHFFRYIVREKRGLARARLISVLACCQFGILHPAMKLMNDVMTAYGNARITKESSIYPANVKRVQFEVGEPAHSSTNLDCMKQISASSLIQGITQHYGFAIACQFCLCIARIYSVIAESADPAGGSVEATGAKTNIPSSRGKHRKSHHSKSSTSESLSSSISASNAIDIYENSLKSAESIMSDLIKKDFRMEQSTVRIELQLELAMIYMKEWRWEDAAKLSATIIKQIKKEGPPPLNINFIDRSILLVAGLQSQAMTTISYASYNMHDYANAAKFATPYLKSLLMIHKADYDGAVNLLTQIAKTQPITAYHREHVLSCAQLVKLLCYNKKLLEKTSFNPLDLIIEQNNKIFKFFIEELGLYEGRSYFIRDNMLLVRLKHLEALVNMQFNGGDNPIEILVEAQNLMSNRCSYICHGLSFQINATCARIQMQNFLQANPTLIQFWNQEVNPLTSGTISTEFVEKITLLLHTMFMQAPDCVVHPLSHEIILDLALLSGIASSEPQKRLEQSLATLSIASSVRNSKRFIQSLIAANTESSPPSCPFLLMNDNKDQKMRGIASAYYSHVCSLDLPFFNTEISELRTLFFFKCFEEQCSSFKFLQKTDQQVTLDSGQIVGQWYQVDAKIFKSDLLDNATVTAKSSYKSTSTRTTSTRATTAPGKSRNSAVLKGTLFFFIGIIVEFEEDLSKKKVKAIPTESPAKLTPLLLAAQKNDLITVHNEMAEIGLILEDAKRMDSVETQGEAQKEPEANERPSRRRKTTKQPKVQQEQPTSLLKNQAQVLTKNAEVKWNVTVHKAETVFNKSNRIIGYLIEQRNRWPNEIKMNGIEMKEAATISHFFNITYGINEKAPQLAAWLSNCCSLAERPATAK